MRRYLFCSKFSVVSSIFFGGDPAGWDFSLSYCMTLIYEGLFTHVKGGEGFSCEVSGKIAYLVVMSRDEAALLTIQGVTYGKCGVASITVSWDVWRLYSVS